VNANKPAPRTFAQFLAGSFALAIGLSLAVGWRIAALVLEGFFMVALGALLFGGFCLGSFLFHLLCGAPTLPSAVFRGLPNVPERSLQGLNGPSASQYGCFALL
jgi:Domain of unknown function (DUF4395)